MPPDYPELEELIVGAVPMLAKKPDPPALDLAKLSRFASTATAKTIQALPPKPAPSLADQVRQGATMQGQAVGTVTSGPSPAAGAAAAIAGAIGGGMTGSAVGTVTRGAAPLPAPKPAPMVTLPRAAPAPPRIVTLPPVAVMKQAAPILAKAAPLPATLPASRFTPSKAIPAPVPIVVPRAPAMPVNPIVPTAVLAPPTPPRPAIPAVLATSAPVRPSSSLSGTSSRFAPTSASSSASRGSGLGASGRFSSTSSPKGKAMSDHNAFLNFDQDGVAAGATVAISRSPLSPMEGAKFYIPPTEGRNFKILGIKIGAEDLFLGGTGISGEAFSGTDGLAWIKLGRIDTNTPVVVTVKNMTAAAADFSGSVAGIRVA